MRYKVFFIFYETKNFLPDFTGVSGPSTVKTLLKLKLLDEGDVIKRNDVQHL